MAKKKGFLGGIADFFIKMALSPLVQEAEDLMDKAHRKVLHLQKRILQRFTTAFLGCLAVLFLITALMFLLMDDLEWSGSVSFGFVGALLLILMFAFSYATMRD